MEINNAISLANFINDNSDRFKATVLDFGKQGAEKGWVIVLDKKTGVYYPPIADAQDYLRRTHPGSIPTEETCRGIVSEWVAREATVASAQTVLAEDTASKARANRPRELDPEFPHLLKTWEE